MKYPYTRAEFKRLRRSTHLIRVKVMIRSGLPTLTRPIQTDLERLGWVNAGETRTSKSTYVEYLVEVSL